MQSSPIFRLSPELLGLIFLYVFNSDKSCPVSNPRVAAGRSRWQEKTRTSAWTNLLLVCHYWRSYVLDYAFLWTRIEAVNLQWMEASLRRSRSLPLELKLVGETLSAMEPDEKLRVISLAVENMHRVRELSIETSRDIFASAKLFHLLARKAAPKLEALTLSRGSDSLLGTAMGFGQEWIGQLSGGNAPNLRRLYVRSNFGHIRMQSPIFQSLTHLELSSQFRWTLESMEDLITCMETWTQMHTLILQNSLPRHMNIFDFSTTPSPPPWRIIRMPHLRQLKVSDPAEYANHFLSHIQLHPLTSLSLECGNELPDELDLVLHQYNIRCLLNVLRHVPPETSSHVTSAVWICRADIFAIYGLAGRIDEMQNPQRHPEFTSDLALRLHMPVVVAQAERGRDLVAIFNALNLPKLDTLVFDISDRLSMDSWVTILRPMKKLRVLVVLMSGDGHEMEEFFRALSSPRVKDGRSPILPFLKQLRVEQPSFPIPTWEILLDALKARRNRKAHDLRLRVVTETELPKEDIASGLCRSYVRSR
ncbi:hypothetical protein DENSPDRAFT_881469 [Dentipellis sp. KUC8613]|nr:hypothetical protein DENSPDRAFT_881469 [Dentipellis sp. KUC8613]